MNSSCNYLEIFLDIFLDIFYFWYSWLWIVSPYRVVTIVKALKRRYVGESLKSPNKFDRLFATNPTGPNCAGYSIIIFLRKYTKYIRYQISCHCKIWATTFDMVFYQGLFEILVYPTNFGLFVAYIVAWQITVTRRRNRNECCMFVLVIPDVALQRCSYKKLFCKFVANSQESNFIEITLRHGCKFAAYFRNIFS